MHLRESLATKMNLLLVGFESFRYVALPACFVSLLADSCTAHASSIVRRLLILRDVIFAKYYSTVNNYYLLCSYYARCFRVPTMLKAMLA